MDDFRRLRHDTAVLGFNHFDDDVLLALGRAAVTVATTVTSGVTARVATGVAAVGTASGLHREGAVACYRDEINKQMNERIQYIINQVYSNKMMKTENLLLCLEMLRVLIPLASL